MPATQSMSWCVRFATVMGTRREDHGSVARSYCSLHQSLLVALMISLTLRSICVLDNIAEIKTVLYRRSSYILFLPVTHYIIVGASTQKLNLLLLYLFYAFAPEILQVPQAPIVLDIIDDSGEVLLIR